MKKYTDSKFDGDLSFLNEHLEQAITNFNDALHYKGRQENSFNAERKRPEENKVQNKENFSINQNSRTSLNVKSRRNEVNSIMVTSSNFENSKNEKDLTNFGQSENEKNVKSTNHFHEINSICNSETEQDTGNHLHQSERIGNNKPVLNTYAINKFKAMRPSTVKRKSQLEMMLHSSGFDMELFNDLKEELLELEKDNIIINYKQDLIMNILTN